MTTIKEGKMKIQRRVPAPLQSYRRRAIESHESWRIDYVALYPSLSSLYPHLSFIPSWKSVNLSLLLLPSISVGVHTQISSSQIFVTFSLTSYRGRAVASWKRIKEQERGDRDRGKKGKRGGIIKYAPRGNSYLSLESIIIHAFLS